MVLKNPDRCQRMLILDRDVMDIAKTHGDNLSEVARELLRSYYFDNGNDLEREEEEIERIKQTLAAREKNLILKKQEKISEESNKNLDSYRVSWIQNHNEYLEKFMHGKVSTKGWLYLSKELKFTSRKKCEEFLFIALGSRGR